MFGTFRFVLALMVVWWHVMPPGGYAGPVAVFGFYCLSGYLMTRVINETYNDGVSGFGRYLANRALRIYPAFWCAALVGLAVVAVVPVAALEVNPAFRPVSSWSDFLTRGHTTFRNTLVPQAWSIGVEVIYYVLIGLFLGRRPWIAIAWFVFGAETVIFAAIYGYPIDWFYYSAWASSLPFATGALIYHFRSYIPRLPKALPIVAVLLVITAGALMTENFGRAGGLYVGLAAAALAVAALAQHRSKRFDDRLGDLAYPVFLLHVSAGAIGVAVFGGKGWASCLTAAVLSILVGWLVVFFVERPIQSLRGIVRRPRSTLRLRAHAEQP